MTRMIDRRKFLKEGAVVTGALAATGKLRADTLGKTVVLGIMGVNGRGLELAAGFSGLEGVEIAYLCDVDDRSLGKAIKSSGDKFRGTGVKDFRRILDDRRVDALVVAAPDHWHAPATILACSAGKHVYVEKPASHNPREGELMIAAAHKNNRLVQLGTQRRSMPKVMEAIAQLHEGVIGKPHFSRGWYNNLRPSIGHGKPAMIPNGLDYSLWQGPAPEREFHDNYLHYNWHWFWHWGTGELGNNGIHALDVCRWGLGVDYPLRVTSGGGKYRHDDDQETPDTHVVTFDFGDKSITWEGRSWHPRGFEGSQFGISFYGENGTMVIDGGGYALFDMKDKLIRKESGSGSATPHFQNFVNAIRSGEKLNAPIEEGHRSTMLCHLGNIAYRTGHTLHLDRENHHPIGGVAEKLWSREYRPGWEPRV